VKDDGQSLVEFAIALPLLLLILVGLVDIGRVFHYTVALSTGAREGAAYAARLITPDDPAVLRRICDASGVAPVGEPCPGMRLNDATVGGEGGGFVDVTYDLDLLFGRILGLAQTGPVHLHATATFPRLTP
jgi:Flp pilus assembly protein TadG